jgi:myo-inositol catabolism protein IolC
MPFCWYTALYMKAPQNLFVLPFDHQTGLFKAFGWTEPLSDEQIQFVIDSRHIIYEGYQHGITLGIPAQSTAILTDDIYGNQVIIDAKKDNYPLIYTLEKSGQPSLVFQHEDWKERVLQNKPEWIKTLVRYNPDANRTDLDMTLANLKIVSNFAQAHQIPFMIEPLVQPTDEQKNLTDFDHALRPDLTVRMIHEIYDAEILPTIWKIEGSDDINFYNKAADAIASHDTDARIVVLGRNETIEKVSEWISVGAQNSYVVGFAVGRTVFLDSIMNFLHNTMTRDEAVRKIGENYYTIYKAFIDAKTRS